MCDLFLEQRWSLCTQHIELSWQVLALESNIRSTVFKSNPTHSATEIEAAVTRKMRKIAVQNTMSPFA